MPMNISVDRGQPVVDPITLSPGTVVKVDGSVPLPFRRALAALSVSTANILSMASLAGIVPGQFVAGNGLANGTTVQSVLPGSKQVVLSAPVNAPVASGASLSFAVAAISTAATAPAGTNLAVPTAGLSSGMTISGPGVDPGLTVLVIVDGANLTMSAGSTAGIASGVTVTFALAGGRTTSAPTNPGATTPLNLHVVTTDPDGLLGNGYENVIGALVYNERMTSYAKLSRAVARGWSLVPMANITPASPTYT